jgi:hypothetical protein
MSRRKKSPCNEVVPASEKSHQGARRRNAEDEESKPGDLLRCNEKRSSGPAVSHRLAAVRTAAAALAGMTVPALPELRHGKWDSGERDAAAGGEGQWRKRLCGMGGARGFGVALRRACCARRVWNCVSRLPIAISDCLGARKGSRWPPPRPIHAPRAVAAAGDCGAVRWGFFC